jgi:hypothetical protein
MRAKGWYNMATTTTELTVGQWLKNMATSTMSNENDDKIMQSLIRRCGFPKGRVTCGIVYLDPGDAPLDIHTVAAEILKRQ